ncbi:MAG: LysM peptidoglycan-binding domain-containing protein [Bacteroidota bacterium]
MSIIKYSILFIVVLLVTANHSYAIEGDSLRLERRPEGHFVIHRVDAGETLYSLSKRYAADLAKIVEANKIEGYSVDAGQIIAIPYSIEQKEAENSSDRTRHTVKAGETLYAISHIYGVNIYDIKSWNNLDSDNLDLGQVLIVSPEKNPAKTTNETSQPSADQKVNSANNTANHTVKKGETLYSISKKYDLPQDEIIKLNNLDNSNLSIGQVLIVKSDNSLPKEKPDEVKVTPPVKVVEKKLADSTELKVVTVNPAIDSSALRKPRFGEKVVNSDTQFEKVYEEGIAMEIENSPKTKKYLCLHRSLAIGTIIQVKNLMNSQSIFVRVVGKLPEIGANENVLIRLSSVAYKRLGAIDARFPVELSYIPE